ncbi:hypothetical protein [Candidatus Nitrosocosmicus arcticus]|uniref:hypothetical protein n=1 Tax=Candidatus Nitrosocosmicus arcticus TaxID=2035267 RepID=UPI001645AB34|nr:hypothetical protein [Candidatus Nitrosocosmicus arcticus]
MVFIVVVVEFVFPSPLVAVVVVVVSEPVAFPDGELLRLLKISSTESNYKFY